MSCVFANIYRFYQQLIVGLFVSCHQSNQIYSQRKLCVLILSMSSCVFVCLSCFMFILCGWRGVVRHQRK